MSQFNENNAAKNTRGLKERDTRGFSKISKGLTVIILIPVLLSAKSTHWKNIPSDPGLLSGGLVLTGAGLMISGHNPPVHPFQLDKTRINPLDRPFAGTSQFGWMKYSDLALGACTLMPLVLMARESMAQTRKYQALMYVESLLFTTGIVFLCKGTFQRPRPYTYASSWQPAGRRDDSRSFFSGHAALAFMSVVYTGCVLTHQSPDSDWNTPVWILGISCASAAGIFRILSGKHFPTDVITGAVAGSLIGYAIPKLHEKKQHSPVTLMKISIPL